MKSIKPEYASKMDMFNISAADIHYMLNQLSLIVDELCEKKRFEDAAFLRWAIEELDKEYPEYEI